MQAAKSKMTRVITVFIFILLAAVATDDKKRIAIFTQELDDTTFNQFSIQAPTEHQFLFFFNSFDNQSSPSYKPSPLVAQVACMYQLLFLI